MIDFMKEIALEAGEILRRFYYDKCEVSTKAGREMVTSADLAAEKALRQRIGKAFPGHAILAEEMGGKIETKGYLWIIDPLDGTNNFAKNFPMFSVSIGLAKDGEIIMGTVYEPLRNELFWADDTGAYMNDKPIHVSDTVDLAHALLATGFPYDMAPDNENNLEHFKHFCLASQGMRRTGSAAIDLCYTACGRLDGFWEIKLKAWDIAGGFKVLEKAGGICTDYTGKRWQIGGDRVVAANPVLHPEMLNIIKEHPHQL